MYIHHIFTYIYICRLCMHTNVHKPYHTIIIIGLIFNNQVTIPGEIGLIKGVAIQYAVLRTHTHTHTHPHPHTHPLLMSL